MTTSTMEPSPDIPKPQCRRSSSSSAFPTGPVSCSPQHQTLDHLTPAAPSRRFTTTPTLSPAIATGTFLLNDSTKNSPTSVRKHGVFSFYI